jgi:hypothetical protein
MKLLRLLIFSSCLLTVIFITGCNEEPISSATPINTGVQLSKFSLPQGETLSSATLHIYINEANNQSVNIYQVNKDWAEMGVTWENRPDIAATPEISYTPDATGWKTIDITSLVQNWLDGTSPNYGLLLDQISTDWSYTKYDSREGTNKPFVDVEYSGGNADVPDIADAYIWQLNPTVNYGSSIDLYTGYVNGVEGYEKQSLLMFDFEPRSGGCTLTPGYWKTHSKYGPAPYNSTWEQVGEDTPFFLSEQTYYEVLWTSPSGNAYYNLSFHYIAAGLNFLNGADPSAAQAAYDEATALFETYTPAEIAALRGNNSIRQKFIYLAGILGDYNEGFIGPGHCDDQRISMPNSLRLK